MPVLSVSSGDLCRMHCLLRVCEGQIRIRLEKSPHPNEECTATAREKWNHERDTEE